jgi:hypothetical protein
MVMTYFIRRFLKGLKGSGTADIWTSEEPMTDDDFQSFARIYGEGKYILCVRGRGIRGFRKLAETFVEPPMRVFSAEDTVSVSADVSVKNLSNEQLLGVLEEKSAEGEVDSILDELQKRLGEVQENAADEVLASAGFPIGSKLGTFMVGALTGGVVVYLINKKKIDSLNEEIASLKATVKNAEEAIRNVEKKTEELSKPMSFDQQMLMAYNSMNGVNLS